MIKFYLLSKFLSDISLVFVLTVFLIFFNFMKRKCGELLRFN